MKRWVLIATLGLSGCAHALMAADDPCHGRTDFQPGQVASCCLGNSWIWNGHACFQDMGHCACECTGPDCGQGYPTLESCMSAMSVCRGNPTPAR